LEAKAEMRAAWVAMAAVGSVAAVKAAQAGQWVD